LQFGFGLLYGVCMRLCENCGQKLTKRQKRFCSYTCLWAICRVDRTEPLDSRFWRHVDKHGPLAISHTTGRKIGRCWEWTAYLNPQGYGNVGLDEKAPSGKPKTSLSHRAAWFLAEGRWPTYHLEHLCDNPSCVRRSHLEDVPQATNNRRSPRPKLQQCKYGHKLSGDNLYTTTRVVAQDGRRIEVRNCKKCALRRSAERRARNLA